MTPEQLKLADKIEGWSPEKWKPLTLIAHERRLAVAFEWPKPGDLEKIIANPPDAGDRG